MSPGRQEGLKGESEGGERCARLGGNGVPLAFYVWSCGRKRRVDAAATCLGHESAAGRVL
jgi:hypothetical protein